MTEKTEENSDDRHQLLHLTNISFVPADVVSVRWEMKQDLSKKVITMIRTRFETFVLEEDSPHYAEDLETLKKAMGKL